MIIRDRVAQTTNSIGTGNIELNGTLEGFKTFAGAQPEIPASSDKLFPVLVKDGDAWELFESYLISGSPNQLFRGALIGSSAIDSARIALSSAENKPVYLIEPAENFGPMGGRSSFAVTDGTEPDYAAAFPVPIRALNDGTRCTIVIHAANTSADNTFAPDGLTAKPMKAGRPLRKIAPGRLPQDLMVTLQFSVDDDAWIVLTPLPRVTKTVSGSAYTVLEEDDGVRLVFTNAGAVAVTLPEATGQFAEPFELNYLAAGAGTVTVTPTTSTIAVGAAAAGASMAATSGQSGTIWAAGGNYRATQIGASAAAVAAGSMRNLLWKNNAGTPNSKVDITADEVVLKDAGGNTKLFSAVNVTVDMAAAGANGLDTGAEAPSTWYHEWLFGKADGTLCGAFSISATAPTLPTGYTFSLLVGAIYNDGSSNFRKSRGDGRRVWQAAVNVLAAGTVSAAGTLQSMSISTAVPAIAKACSGIMGTDTNGGIAIAVAGDANGVGIQETAWNTIAGNLMNGYYGAAPFIDVPLITAQTIYRTASSTSGLSRIDVSGFTI